MKLSWTFRRKWLSTAFGPAWVIATGTVASLVAIGSGVAGKLYPEWQGALAELSWEIPLATLLLLFTWRLGFAGYILERGENQRLRTRIAELGQSLREATMRAEEAQAHAKSANRKLEQLTCDEQIADFFAEQYRRGLKDLLPLLKMALKAPEAEEEDWAWVHYDYWRWEKELLEVMKELGCTAHEIVAVDKVIPRTEEGNLVSLSPAEMEAIIEQIGKLADKYAGFVETAKRT